MGEMIDRGALYKAFYERECDAMELDNILAAIVAAPTVDAAPVVRCKDCAMCDRELSLKPGMMFCDNFDQNVSPKFFCAAGRARMDADAPERAGQGAQQGGEVGRDE